MSYENIKLWFAKNDERVVTIDEVNNENKNNTYMCPVCGSDLKPKAINSKRICPHFAHVDSSKCNSESQIHFWFKHKFLENGDKFTVAADKVRNYICDDIIVEKEYKVGEYTYRPDVTVLTECGETIYFEMAFSNKKKVKDYLDIWLELRNIVVEVDIKQLMLKESLPTFKSLFYDGKCFNTKRNDTYYNTVGKYKEYLSAETNLNSKQRALKLDWFWEDLIRYKNEEVDEKHILNLISYIDKSDLGLVLEILKKQTCLNLFEKYIEFLANKRLEELRIHFEDTLLDDCYGFSIEYVVKYKKVHSALLKLCYSGEYSTFYIQEGSYDILKNSFDNMVDQLSKLFDHNEKVISDLKLKEYTRESPYIKNAILNIEQKYKKLDEKYSLFMSSVGNPDIGFVYNNSIKFYINLPSEIVYSDNSSQISCYIDEKLLEYVNKIIPIPNKGDILSTLKILKSQFNNLFINEYKVFQGYGMWAKQKTKKAILHFDFNCETPDIIQIKIDTQHRWIQNPDINLIIHGNRLYQSKWGVTDSKEIIELKDSKKISLIKCYTTEIDIVELKKLIWDYICNLIQKQLIENVCKSCNKNLKLELGEINFFIERGLSFPKRCKPCRKKEKKSL